MDASWIDSFEELKHLEPRWKQAIAKRGRILCAPAKTTLFSQGATAEDMIFLLKGTVRVQQISEAGREIVLYRIEAGQGCIMTASCLNAHQNYAAEGVSETDIEAAVIPKKLFEELLSGSSLFREFVFSTFSNRLIELMLMINEVAFKRIDLRLAQKLIELAKGTSEIKTTHQQLAIELGTAREVISRQLQEFQRQNWIQQSRGIILVKNKDGLSKIITAA